MVTVIEKILYSILFGLFIMLVGRYLNKTGSIFLSDAFESKVANAVSGLLNIGFYMVSVGLLFWFLGSGGYPGPPKSPERIMRDVATQLGVSIFVVGLLHSFNVLAVAILSRKSRGQ